MSIVRDMIGPLDLYAAWEIRKNLVSRSRLARIRTPINRLDPHSFHQRLDMAAIDEQVLAP